MTPPVTSAAPQVLTAPVGPWPGFAMAGEAAVRDLHARFGLDLWLVSHVDGDRQVVVASTGAWSASARPGQAFCWSTSLCVRMVGLGGAVAVPDVHAAPGFAEAAVEEKAAVGAYLGVPLLTSEGPLFGTLCGFAGSAQPPSLSRALEPTRLLGRMLSTILAGEQAATDRSHDAAEAFALAERDPLTRLANRRGWDAALAGEEQRSRRYGSSVSLLAVDLDGLRRLNEAEGHAAGDVASAACAAVLRECRRPGDTLARVGGDEFAVLAVECDAVCARALERQLRVRLRSVGLAASVGSATRRPHEGLEGTWERAGAALERDKRRRPAAR